MQLSLYSKSSTSSSLVALAPCKSWEGDRIIQEQHHSALEELRGLIIVFVGTQCTLSYMYKQLKEVQRFVSGLADSSESHTSSDILHGLNNANLRNLSAIKFAQTDNSWVPIEDARSIHVFFSHQRDGRYPHKHDIGVQLDYVFRESNV